MMFNLLTCVLLASTAPLDARPEQATSRLDRPTPLVIPALQQPFDWKAERRACEGCPRRSVGRAFFQTTMINVFYEAANLIRGQDTAKITPKTWWDNMEQGWVWDLDDFVVNQVGHPYQGNNYFTSGRANGLSFYESAAADRLRQQHVGILSARRTSPR